MVVNFMPTVMIKDENKNQSIVFSVILPIFNEGNCLVSILERIKKTLEAMNKNFEIICVDDGSVDGTWDIIGEFSQSNRNIKGIRFQRNFGHQIAIYAGIQQSSGQYIAILDADGQDPPELLPKLFQECMKGYDVVYTIRKKRKESLLKRVSYKLFYRFYKFIVPFTVPLDSGDFGVFNRQLADFIKDLPEKTPFIRGLRSWYGGRQLGVEYEREGRLKGIPKYSFIKLILLAVNASFSFSKLPLRVFAILGILISIASAIYGLSLLIIRLLFGKGIFPWGWTTMILLIVFFGGLNLFAFGIIGEYIGNIFDEVKNRPRYLVRNTVGF